MSKRAADEAPWSVRDQGGSDSPEKEPSPSARPANKKSKTSLKSEVDGLKKQVESLNAKIDGQEKLVENMNKKLDQILHAQGSRPSKRLKPAVRNAGKGAKRKTTAQDGTETEKDAGESVAASRESNFAVSQDEVKKWARKHLPVRLEVDWERLDENGRKKAIDELFGVFGDAEGITMLKAILQKIRPSLQKNMSNYMKVKLIIDQLLTNGLQRRLLWGNRMTNRPNSDKISLPSQFVEVINAFLEEQGIKDGGKQAGKYLTNARCRVGKSTTGTNSEAPGEAELREEGIETRVNSSVSGASTSPHSAGNSNFDQVIDFNLESAEIRIAQVVAEANAIEKNLEKKTTSKQLAQIDSTFRVMQDSPEESNLAQPTQFQKTPHLDVLNGKVGEDKPEDTSMAEENTRRGKTRDLLCQALNESGVIGFSNMSVSCRNEQLLESGQEHQEHKDLTKHNILREQANHGCNDNEKENDDQREGLEQREQVDHGGQESQRGQDDQREQAVYRGQNDQRKFVAHGEPDGQREPDDWRDNLRGQAYPEGQDSQRDQYTQTEKDDQREQADPGRQDSQRDQYTQTEKDDQREQADPGRQDSQKGQEEQGEQDNHLGDVSQFRDFQKDIFDMMHIDDEMETISFEEMLMNFDENRSHHGMNKDLVSEFFAKMDG